MAPSTAEPMPPSPKARPKKAGHRADFAGNELLCTDSPRCRDNRPLKAVKFHTLSSEANFRKTHSRILARNGFPDNVGLSSGAKVARECLQRATRSGGLSRSVHTLQSMTNCGCGTVLKPAVWRAPLLELSPHR